MDTAKVVFFFTSGVNGWQEVYYCNASTLDAAFTLAQNLRDKRALLMGDPTRLDAIRVADAKAVRVSTLTPVNTTGPLDYTSKSDKVQSAQMMRLYAPSANRSRPLYLRGNPDDVYDQVNPNNADRQLWEQRYLGLGSFLSGQANNPGGWLIKDKPQAIFSGPGTNVIGIFQFVPDPISTRGFAKVTTMEPHGLDAGDFVTLYKIKGIPRAGGVYKVDAIVDAANFTVPFHYPQGFSYQGGGSMLEYEPGFVAISQFSFNSRDTERLTGRPFEVTRGRRRSIPR